MTAGAHDDYRKPAPHPRLSMHRLARYVNVALGAVLLVAGLSGAIGGMLAPLMATAGLVVLLSALLALKEPAARIGSLAAGVILFIATLVLRGVTHTGAWLGLGLSILVVAMALVPATDRSPVHT